MSAELLTARWTRPSRLRAIRDDMLLGMPIVFVATALAWRFGGMVAAVTTILIGATAVALVAERRARRFDRGWLVAAIDAARADAEDSSDLLFAAPATLGPLARLQRTRIEARLAAQPLPDLRTPRPPRLIAAAWAAALALTAAIALIPGREGDASLAPSDEGLPATPGIPRLIGQRLTVTPPAYTGLPTRTLATLDARVPAGSRLTWTLRFAPEPGGAALAFPTGAAQSIRRDRDIWTVTRTLDRSLLYRVVPQGTDAIPPLHRIEIVADRPPWVTLRTPATTLVAMTPGQRTWPIAFEATDDYGVAVTARLRLVVAQGEGENVRFSERTIAIAGQGAPTKRLFSAWLDLPALGFTEPGDLVAQLTVTDAMSPSPHSVAGPSVILRRAAAQAGESGLEAMTRRAMPAYFSSQRQVIIDAESLLAQRPRPARDAFLARSDSIGNDQRLLRMRYGQFMGEEAGGGATAAMPTSDTEEAPATASAPTPADPHDHDAPAAAPIFGADNNVLAEFGHTHDESEAATLLDPGTRATLRKALDAMWASERALRQGDPRAALPHANTALRFIKQVQQATRIFLARTGSRLPPIDLSRRLTGDRGDLGPRTLAATAAPPVDATPGAIWRALAQRSDPAALDALARWVDANASRVPDPLALTAAIDTLRRRPDCASCREAVRGALWSALPRPPAGTSRRNAGDATGRRYLDALR